MLYYSRTKINNPLKGKLIKITKTKNNNNSGEIEETFEGVIKFIKKHLSYYLEINKYVFIHTLSESEKIEVLLSSKVVSRKLKEKINLYYNL
ncbi:hypothetical protein [Fusobacterium polymorphum]|uniref:hypothetical protein n=1 Tax=Fusobacterium nucleatum subsp. polymorphum TaxID=76857 RepID=UPI00300BACB4